MTRNPVAGLTDVTGPVRIISGAPGPRLSSPDSAADLLWAFVWAASTMLATPNSRPTTPRKTATFRQLTIHRPPRMIIPHHCGSPTFGAADWLGASPRPRPSLEAR